MHWHFYGCFTRYITSRQIGSRYKHGALFSPVPLKGEKYMDAK